MKAHLMYRDRDFDVAQSLPSNAEALTQDLALDTLFEAMADGDAYLLQVAERAVLSGMHEDRETILYRQAVLRDCLRNESVVKGMYEIALEAIERKRKDWLGSFSRHPMGILHGSLGLLRMSMDLLEKLRRIGDGQSGRFESKGFTALFALLKAELGDEYLDRVKADLKDLEFREGLLMSAGLGEGNQGTHYVLRKPAGERLSWLQRIFTPGPPSYTFSVADRDLGGHRTLSELQERGVNLVANALAQSADHVLSFFVMLRTELAFYLGCLNLHRRLGRIGVPVCFPVPAPPGARVLSCTDLCDVCLALTLDGTVVGNDLEGDGKRLFVITGANQGGKSTFLRGVGLAQLMMQCGMFVASGSFRAEVCRGLFTHYKREEDATMERGKFEEELRRMTVIADALGPDSMVLFNESFAATNEREGAEVARQIVRALLEARVKVLFVTHMYEFAHGLYEDEPDEALFLRAERRDGGRRTFKLYPGEPLQTGFGVDLYEAVFVGEQKRVGVA